METGRGRALTCRGRAQANGVRSPPGRARPLPGLALKLVVGALPMGEFSAVRPALRDPDAIGAFADAIFVQPGGELDCWRKIGRRDRDGFLARFRFAACFPDTVATWRLSYEQSPCGSSISRPFPEDRPRELRRKVLHHG